MFEPATTPLEYEVVLLPPAYPPGLFPARCRHEPQFVMQAAVTIERDKSGHAHIVIEHAMCLACGMPTPCSYGGNVFVDLHMLWEHLGWHAQIGSRLLLIRGKWARVARRLFGPDGWNGRHERIARLIDPKLTMTLEVTSTGRADVDGREMLLGQVTSYDLDYRRWDDEAEA